MQDTQRESPATDQATSSDREDDRTPESTIETVARLLANPRRIRRD
jgi:hypothetical protein